MNNKKLIEWLKEYYADQNSIPTEEITDGVLLEYIRDEQKVREIPILERERYDLWKIIATVGNKYIGYFRVGHKGYPQEDEDVGFGISNHLNALQEYVIKSVPQYVIKQT